jgi:hypothetical protein
MADQQFTSNAAEQDAYQAGEVEGETHRQTGRNFGCLFDGRTRLGKAWWAGFMVGDRRYCEAARAGGGA